jgi:thioredoxin-like negative regulator of GroEL
MLCAFKSLVRETREPILVTFHRREAAVRRKAAPFTEVIHSEYRGKIRAFELDYQLSRKIMEYFRLPRAETAVIFQDGKASRKYHGYRNVRQFLRNLAQAN